MVRHAEEAAAEERVEGRGERAVPHAGGAEVVGLADVPAVGLQLHHRDAADAGAEAVASDAQPALRRADRGQRLHPTG